MTHPRIIHPGKDLTSSVALQNQNIITISELCCYQSFWPTIFRLSVSPDVYKYLCKKATRTTLWSLNCPCTRPRSYIAFDKYYLVFSNISSHESKIFWKALALSGKGRASSKCRSVEKTFFNKSQLGFLAIGFQNAGVQFYSVAKYNLGFD